MQEEIIRTLPMRTPEGKINDEITKAKNRYRIYRDQANRIARRLTDAERHEGFARLMEISIHSPRAGGDHTCHSRIPYR